MAILLARSPIAPVPVIASSEAVHLSTRNLLEGLTALVVGRPFLRYAAAADEPPGSRPASGGGTMDFFATLAMTAEAPARSSCAYARLGATSRAVSDAPTKSSSVSARNSPAAAGRDPTR